MLQAGTASHSWTPCEQEQAMLEDPTLGEQVIDSDSGQE